VRNVINNCKMLWNYGDNLLSGMENIEMI